MPCAKTLYRHLGVARRPAGRGGRNSADVAGDRADTTGSGVLQPFGRDFAVGAHLCSIRQLVAIVGQSVHSRDCFQVLHIPG